MANLTNLQISFTIIYMIAEKLYLTMEDPLSLWNDLKDRFDLYRAIFLPKANHVLLNLRLQDYVRASDYSSALFCITS